MAKEIKKIKVAGIDYDVVDEGAARTSHTHPEYAGAMQFKGTLGTGGTITSLPAASSSNKGFMYKVITAGTYASQTAKVGDAFISDGSTWVIIPSGDEQDTDTWRQINVNGTQFKGNGISSGLVNFKAGENITLSTSGNDLTIKSNGVNASLRSMDASVIQFGDGYVEFMNSGAEVEPYIGYNNGNLEFVGESGFTFDKSIDAKGGLDVANGINIKESANKYTYIGPDYFERTDGDIYNFTYLPPNGGTLATTDDLETKLDKTTGGTVSGNITANSFTVPNKIGFLKANGTVDSVDYLPQSQFTDAGIINALGYTPAGPTLASHTGNGLMAKADKIKLDTLPSDLPEGEVNITLTSTSISDGTTTFNKYTHPNYTSHNSGLYKVAVDGTGHVSSATAVVKSDITALGIPAQDTTYSDATTTVHGLMSTTDKSKLNGIASGAQVNNIVARLNNGDLAREQDATVNFSIYMLSPNTVKVGDIVIDSWGSVGKIIAKTSSSVTIQTIHVSATEFYTCLAAGTTISMADGTKKPIEEIQVGDIVKSYDYNNKVNNEAVVMNCTRTGSTNLFDTMLFTDGTTLELKGENERLYKVEDECCHDYTRFNYGDHVLLENGETKQVEKVISNVPTVDGEYKGYYSLTTSNCAFFANGILMLNMSKGRVKLFKNILHIDFPDELKDILEQDKEWYAREREIAINKKSIKTDQKDRKAFFESQHESQRLRKDMAAKDYKGIKLIEKMMKVMLASSKENLVENLLTFAAEEKAKYDQYLIDRQAQRDAINAQDQIALEKSKLINDIDKDQINKDGYSKNFIESIKNNLRRMAAKDNAAFERYKEYYTRKPEEEIITEPEPTEKNY